MLIDLLSTDNYVVYNYELANSVGLHAAIYINELINISKKAEKKKKLIDDKYFIVDRKYITLRTTFPLTEQRSLDTFLEEHGLVERGEKLDSIYVNIEQLTQLLLGESLMPKVTVPPKPKTVVAPVAEVALPKTKVPQKVAIANKLKSFVYSTNKELFDAYIEWIDSVCDKIGWMSQKAVMVGQQVVDDYAKGNLDVALKIVEIGTLNGWKDLNYAIDVFEKDYKSKFMPKSSEPPAARKRAVVSDEVF